MDQPAALGALNKPGAGMKVFAYQAGAWQEAGDLEPDAARDLAWGPTLVWVRLEGLAQGKLESLGAVFDLHPLAMEDVMSHRQRPKVEDYPNLTFVVVRAPRWDRAADEMSWLTLGIFLGPDFLITVCTDPVAELDHVVRRLLAAKPTAKGASIDQVFYQVVDAVVDSYFPIMDELEDRIEAIEEGVLESPERAELGQIQNIKHIVSQVRKTIYPMREAMVALEKGDYPNVREETQVFLRDVADHTTRLTERLDHVKDVAVLAHESYFVALQNQTNRVIKALTGITIVITLPMLFGTFFGMNVPGIPTWSFWSVVGGLSLMMLPLYFVARKLDWL